MTGTDELDRTAASGWAARAAVLALVANVFAIGAVTFWIYYARMLFGALRPDYVAVQPPTISRAISEPTVGEPFSFWITVSAIFLGLGVFCLGSFYRRVSHWLTSPSRYLARLLAVGIPVIVFLQTMAGVGMYILSTYRFPDFNQVHMVGSYLFFLSQAMVIVVATMLSSALLRDQASLQELQTAGLMSKPMIRIRLRAGQIAIVLMVVYILLFKVKDLDLNVMNDTIYIAYTTVEPVLITAFLVVLGLFQTDLLALRRMAQRGP